MNGVPSTGAHARSLARAMGQMRVYISPTLLIPPYRQPHGVISRHNHYETPPTTTTDRHGKKKRSTSIFVSINPNLPFET